MSDKITIDVDDAKVILECLAAVINMANDLDCATPKLVRVAEIARDMKDRLAPSLKTIRRPPTDQDAIDQPRRKCWVRNQSPDTPWEDGLLLSVDKFRGHTFYTAILDNDLPRPYSFCEIEVLSE
jgi:hypothetical protein